MTPTLLPLYTFAKRLGLNPIHFMGVDVPNTSADNRVCIHALPQYSWQDADGVSRDELSGYVAEAEENLAGALGYWPISTWTADERIELPIRTDNWFNDMFDVRGDRLAVKTKYGQLISGGKQGKYSVQTGVAVTYTDTDSDLYFETATITVNTSLTNAEEIAVFYPGLSGDEEWQVRPISCSISGSVATITCRREQLVKKEILESLDWHSVNGLDNSNFLTTVDVYRIYHDPSIQVELVWRGGGCCSDGSCGSCSLTIQSGCTTIKDKQLGLLTMSPADWNGTDFDATCLSECRRPDYVRMWYRSGFRNMTYSRPNLQMVPEFELAICKLAISKIDRNICSCKGIEDKQTRWNTDLRRSNSTQASANSYRVTPYELEACPFGSTLAALDVWRLVKRRGLGIEA